MSTRLMFTGIGEARAELRAQPQALAKATQTLAMRVARDARADIKAAYPRRHKKSGVHLADGVVVRQGRGAGKVVASAQVVNVNPIAHNYEHGTQARHTRHGIDRGVMPAGNVFIPRIVRWRWLFFQSVKEIMQAAGITVQGDA